MLALLGLYYCMACNRPTIPERNARRVKLLDPVENKAIDMGSN